MATIVLYVDVYNLIKFIKLTNTYILIIIKMSTQSCPKCQQLQKKLKVAVSDYQFQIKKIQQDKSTDKVMYEIHLQKQMRRVLELYNKQKSQRQQETKTWMDKHASTVAKYQQQIESLIAKHESQMYKSVSSLKQTHQKQTQKIVKQYQQKISKLISQNQSIVNTLKTESHNKLTKISNQHEQYCSQIKKAHKSTLEQSTKQYESRLLGIQCQKIKEVKLHESTKAQSKQLQYKLYQQQFQLRKQITDLSARLSQQTRITNAKNTQIQELNMKIQQLNANHKTEIKQMEEYRIRMIEDCREEYRNKIDQVYKQNLEYCNKYQTTIQKIQESKQTQKAIFQSHIEQINCFIENRVSRPEDVEAIQVLKEILAKKNKQCEMLTDELKFFRLELQNKQQTYNKIFTPILHPNNQNAIYRRKQFKLRRQGKSVTTVREALMNTNSLNMGERKNTGLLPPRPKIL